MAFCEVIPVKHRIERLLNSARISLAPPFREILEFAFEEVESLQEIASRIFCSSMSRLDLEIRVAVNKLCDAIESRVSKQIDSQSESCGGDGIQSSINLQDLKQEIHSLTKRVKMVEEECVDELYNSLAEEEDAVSSSSRIGPAGHKSKMVGLSDQYIELKHKLTNGTKFKVFSLIGMPGIGKTTLANEVFEDPDIVEQFDCRLWVTIGRQCQLKEIPRCILAQLNPDVDYKMLMEGDHEDIAGPYLKESLKGKRYLIVLDDVWNKYMVNYLELSFQYGINGSHYPFPNEENGSGLLLTSRQYQEYTYQPYIDIYVLTLRRLNKEESWDLLREKVFCDESCPSQLERVGKKIAENCDGLPLTIITVAGLLSKAEKTVQYWSEIAAQKNHRLLIDAYDEISRVLLPSYKYLPRLVQMCFLYMGVFPQNYQIPRSKLINLWNVDGFLQKFSYHGAVEFLEELVSNHLVMIYQSTIDPTSPVGVEQIKTCGLHPSLWHLSNREARKNKFSHVLYSLNDGLGEAIKSQRRLSFHNNILLGIKDVYKSVEDNCASSARSLLFYGPYHRYQVPICFNLRLLRELDALTIRFYEFPMEILQLVQLRYLALTLNGNLPASISQLSNLRFLIVSRHLSIKPCRDASYLPVEIWNMTELQHLQVMGNDLPDPCGASLKSLSALSNVSAHSCTEGVLRALPCLQKLGIQIELAPDDDGKPLSCFDHISQYLKTLKSLKLVIINPEVVSPLVPLSIFPSSLTKLSLSGLGYPWKEMAKIASLPCLRLLKLRNYAFRGPEWEVEESGFTSLHFLVIEDTDLVEWKIGPESFEDLENLSLKHCYKLKKIEGEFRLFLENVELVDCNPLCAEQMKKATQTLTKVAVRSSWDERKLINT